MEGLCSDPTKLVCTAAGSVVMNRYVHVEYVWKCRYSDHQRAPMQTIICLITY